MSEKGAIPGAAIKISPKGAILGGEILNLLFAFLQTLGVYGRRT